MLLHVFHNSPYKSNRIVQNVGFFKIHSRVSRSKNHQKNLSATKKTCHCLEFPQCICFFTYASGPGRDDKFCRSISSASLQSIPLNLLGWGTTWQGLQQKFSASLDALRNVNPSCLVVFADAYDVLYAQPPQHFVEQFRKIEARTGSQLVFSAECGCWPQVTIDNGVSCRDRYPPSPTVLRYLNSGGWMGRAGMALQFFEHIVNSFPPGRKHLNDQELASNAFNQSYTRKRFLMTLDYFTELFATMHAIKDNTAVPDCDPTPWYKHVHGSLSNVEMQTHPGLFHFNGGAKRLFDAFETQIRRSHTGKLKADAWINGGLVENVCPELH